MIFFAPSPFTCHSASFCSISNSDSMPPSLSVTCVKLDFSVEILNGPKAALYTYLWHTSAMYLFLLFTRVSGWKCCKAFITDGRITSHLIQTQDRLLPPKKPQYWHHHTDLIWLWQHKTETESATSGNVSVSLCFVLSSTLSQWGFSYLKTKPFKNKEY